MISTYKQSKIKFFVNEISLVFCTQRRNKPKRSSSFDFISFGWTQNVQFTRNTTFYLQFEGRALATLWIERVRDIVYERERKYTDSDTLIILQFGIEQGAPPNQLVQETKLLFVRRAT